MDWNDPLVLREPFIPDPAKSAKETITFMPATT